MYLACWCCSGWMREEEMEFLSMTLRILFLDETLVMALGRRQVGQLALVGFEA